MGRGVAAACAEPIASAGKQLPPDIHGRKGGGGPGGRTDLRAEAEAEPAEREQPQLDS